MQKHCSDSDSCQSVRKNRVRESENFDETFDETSETNCTGSLVTSLLRANYWPGVLGCSLLQMIFNRLKFKKLIKKLVKRDLGE